MTEENFINLFAKFYEEYFGSSSKAIRLLADIQKNYPEQYESIKKFSTDPQAIDKLITEMKEEQQALLLKLLLKAGTFGRRIALLFELSVEEKKKLADEMEAFIKSITKEDKK